MISVLPNASNVSVALYPWWICNMDIQMIVKTSQAKHTILKNLNKIVMNEKFNDLKKEINILLTLLRDWRMEKEVSWCPQQNINENKITQPCDYRKVINDYHSTYAYKHQQMLRNCAKYACAKSQTRRSSQPMASRPLAYWPQPLAEQATKKIKTVQKFLDSPKSTSYKADKN